MRKLLLIILTLAISSAALKAETGLGLVFGDPTNIAVSFRNDRFPIIGLGWNLNDNGYIIANIDYWVLHKKIDKTIFWYVGPGANIYLPIKSSNKIGIALRAPIGIQWIPAKHWEFFGEAAPYLRFIPELDLDIQVGIGFRYLF